MRETSLNSSIACMEISLYCTNRSTTTHVLALSEWDTRQDVKQRTLGINDQSLV